jgi:hypothetical protein
MQNVYHIHHDSYTRMLDTNSIYFVWKFTLFCSVLRLTHVEYSLRESVFQLRNGNEINLSNDKAFAFFMTSTIKAMKGLRNQKSL